MNLHIKNGRNQGRDCSEDFYYSLWPETLSLLFEDTLELEETYLFPFLLPLHLNAQLHLLIISIMIGMAIDKNNAVTPMPKFILNS